MKLFSWGTNSHGQLGQGFQSELVCTPAEVPAGDVALDHPGIQIFGGGNHTVMKSAAGTIFGVGLDTSGQLSCGRTLASFTPLTLGGNTDECVTSVACGWDFSLFLTNQGNLYGCGSNSFGQLMGSVDKCNMVRLYGHQNVKFVAVSAGLRHAAAVTDEGCLLVWGSSRYISQRDDTLRSPGDVPIRKVSCGQHHMLTLDVNGRIYAWGANRYGQCGRKSEECKVVTQPSAIEWDQKNGNIVDMVSGWTHSVLLTDRGHVYSWGRNTYGQLGRTSPDVSSPGRLFGLEDIQSIAAGSEHSMALDAHGRLWTWGWNEHGSCGNGDTQNQHEPVNISHHFPGRIVSIGCGAGHCFAAVE